MYALTFGLLAYMVGVGIIPTVIELLAAQIAPVKEFLSSNTVAADVMHVTFLIVFSFLAIFVCSRFSMRHSMRKNMNPEEANLPENKNNAFASSVLLGLGGWQFFQS